MKQQVKKNNTGARSREQVLRAATIDVEIDKRMKVFRAIRAKDRKCFRVYIPSALVQGFLPVEKVSLQTGHCVATGETFVLVGLTEWAKQKNVRGGVCAYT